MSTHMIEKALFDIAASSANTADYQRSPTTFLSAYALCSAERRLVLELDVGEMLARQVNPMLAMRAFTAVRGRQSLPEYMRQIQAR